MQNETSRVAWSDDDMYTTTGIWRTGWTSDTAHYIVGKARRSGRARYTLMRGACGKPMNPGVKRDPNNLPEGVTLCSSCQAKVNA